MNRKRMTKKWEEENEEDGMKEELCYRTLINRLKKQGRHLKHLPDELECIKKDAQSPL
jgi:hypothetical protein